MACFIRSSAFLNFLLTTHAWKNKNHFFFTSLLHKTFTLSSASTILGPRYFVIFVLWFLTDLKATQSAMGMCWPGHYFCQFDKHLPQPKIKCTRWIRVRVFSTLNLRQWFRIRVISHLYWFFKIVWKFGSPWPSPSVNSQRYIKNECSDMS